MSNIHEDVFVENMKDWFEVYYRDGNLEEMEKIIKDLRSNGCEGDSFKLEKRFNKFRSQIKILV